MPNFKQKCFIKTNYNTKQPELELRQNEKGTVLTGSLQWLDGKKPDGGNQYTWFSFRAYKDEIKELMQNNVSELFEIEGFLKNVNKKKDGEWVSRQWIQITSAQVHKKEQQTVPHFQEMSSNDEEIPF